jgi:hypothetical protein
MDFAEATRGYEAWLARQAGALDLKLADACDAVLAGYGECLAAGGRPFVLEERHPHLRALAMAADRDPAAFWAKTTALLADPPVAVPDDARAALTAVLPSANLKVEYRARPRAGVGSLGRPRYVALTEGPAGGCAGRPRPLPRQPPPGRPAWPPRAGPGRQLRGRSGPLTRSTV